MAAREEQWIWFECDACIEGVTKMFLEDAYLWGAPLGFGQNWIDWQSCRLDLNGKANVHYHTENTVTRYNGKWVFISNAYKLYFHDHMRICVDLDGDMGDLYQYEVVDRYIDSDTKIFVTAFEKFYSPRAFVGSKSRYDPSEGGLRVTEDGIHIYQAGVNGPWQEQIIDMPQAP